MLSDGDTELGSFGDLEGGGISENEGLIFVAHYQHQNPSSEVGEVQSMREGYLHKSSMFVLDGYVTLHIIH